MTKELKELVLDFNERLKLEALPNLFKMQAVNQDSLNFVHKFNILMAQMSLKDASGDPDYVRGMATYCVANFTSILLHEVKKLETLEPKHLSALLQLPFTLMEQLLGTSDLDLPESLKFQNKMMHILIDFYLDLYVEFKKVKADEGLKVTLGFLTESLILAGGSEQAGSTLSLSLAHGDLPRAK